MSALVPTTAGLALAALLLSAGCEKRTLTEADCTLIKGRIQEAWKKDAIAAARLAEKNQFLQFIESEAGRIGDDWMASCKPRVGQVIDAAELECLNKAQTIDDVSECKPR